MSTKNEQKEREKNYIQTSRLENPKELQLDHNNQILLFSTVMLLFALFNELLLISNFS
jgi:hypothetical protein